MAEEQKPVELPKDTTEAAPVVDAPAAETTAVQETAAPTTEAAPAAEDKPAEETPAAAEETKAEEKKEEAKPVEEGSLGHKAQGASFPKNIIASKEFFFFGNDAWEQKSLSTYKSSEKSLTTAQSNIAWAAQTGKGLLFVGDKKSPSGIINLSDASEPVVDGTNKFSLTSKGNKHTFKASSSAERDNWVSQLKLKIAEAKELQPTVVESETYKSTLESFKPKPVVAAAKKEEKPAEEAPKEEAVAAEEAPKTEETPKTDEAAPKEAVKADESKARSSSRKRRSFFGFGGKDEKKEEVKKEETKDEAKAEETVPTSETPATDAVVAPAVVPAVAAEDKPAETEEAPKAEDVPKEEATTPATEEKPAGASKRNSFFGGVFGKKEKKAAEAKPAETTEVAKDAEAAPATETAPVIPPVETSTPLTAEVASPANLPTETVDATPATNGETKKDVKEKRKSSLPFAFGKREKSPRASTDDAAKVEKSDKTEKTEKTEKSKNSPFSKLRATIKGKSSAAKTEDKPAEEATKEEETPAEEAAAPAEEAPKETTTTEDAPKVIEETTAAAEETKPENVATTTPAVTAAA